LEKCPNRVRCPAWRAGAGVVRFLDLVDRISLAGKLRALAVTTTAHSEALPDLPTIGEFASGYEASQSYGVGAPKNTPAAIVDKLNREINAALVDPKIKAKLAGLGGTPLTS
jgi:tripartite-type tricarboxylate transporter receptor subunit TctC